MKILNKTSLIAAAAALTATPVMASAAQPAVNTGQYDLARADAQMVDANEATRGPGTFVIGVLALAAIIAAIIIAADGSDDTPTSP